MTYKEREIFPFFCFELKESKIEKWFKNWAAFTLSVPDNLFYLYDRFILT